MFSSYEEFTDRVDPPPNLGIVKHIRFQNYCINIKDIIVNIALILHGLKYSDFKGKFSRD
jgi:hypothetical protein